MIVFTGVIIFGGNLIYSGLELPIPASNDQPRTPIWMGAFFMLVGMVALGITGGATFDATKK